MTALSTSSPDVVEFGVIESVGRRNAVIRWTALPIKTKQLTSVQRGVYLTPTTTKRARVAIPSTTLLGVPGATGRTRFHRATSLEGLHAGMRVLFAGTLTATGLKSEVISSSTGGHYHSLDSGRKPTLTSGARLRPMATTTQSDTKSFQGCGPVVGSTCDPQTNQLAFTDTLNYSDENDGNGRDLFSVGGFKDGFGTELGVYLKRIDVGFDMGQTVFNWPFQFSATAPDPFYQTERQGVGVQMTPETLGGSGLNNTYTFYQGFGYNLGFQFSFDWKTCAADVCGDVSSNPDEFFLPLFGSWNQTDSAAPMSGTNIDVPATECPSFSIGIPDVPLISAISVKFCFDFKLEGSNITSDVSVPSGGTLTDTSGATQSAINYSFDGANPGTANITPHANPVQLEFSKFYWAPTLDFGGYFVLGALANSVSYTFPTMTFSRGAWPMVGAASDLARVQLAPDNQPTSESFDLPTTPEPTSISYTGGTSGDYHDAATISGQLTAHSGAVLPNEPIYLSFNGEASQQCGTTNIYGAFSCTYTPQDNPTGSPYDLTLSFGGDTTTDGTYASTSDTESFTVNKEESSLSIGGDTSGTYGGSVSMNGTLLEDTSGPRVSGQPIDFNWGYQHCSPVPTTNSSGYASCSVTLTQGAGSYTAADSYSGNDYYLSSNNSHSVSVGQQPATITLDGSDANPVQVTSAGGTANPTVTASFADTLSAGDIQNAVVTYTLTPIGPGSTYTCTVTPSGAVQSNNYQSQSYTVSGSTNCPSTITETPSLGTSATSMTQAIKFTGVQTNVYILSVSVSGSYYTGGPVTGVTTIYDPSLGFTTGGGTVVNPNTGYRANFGFTAKYLKSGQTQGNVLYIEHRPSGDVMLKSNAMGSMTLVNTSSTPPSIAYIQGKATYQTTGNYSFLVTAIDNGNPGSKNDQFGLQVKDPSGAFVSDLTFPATGSTATAPAITNGNIVVPHK
jgi:hypothetical protein